MGRKALKPSPLLARLLRTRRSELRLSARDVEARTHEMGEPIPFPTLIKIERGQQEPGVRRFYALMRLYEVPLELVPDLLELEDLAIQPAEVTDPERLLADGIAHWRAGRVAEALGHLFALRVLTPSGPDGRLLRQKGLLSFSIMARNLGRLKLALQLVNDLLREGPDPSLLPNVLIQAAAVWQYLGSTDAALAFLARAEQVVPADDRARRAGLSHLRADACFASGRLDEALAATTAALQATPPADAGGRAKLLLLKARIAAARGDGGRARRAADTALAAAERSGQVGIVIAARLLRASLETAAGRPARAVPLLEQALAQAISVADKSEQFHAHYHLYKCFEALNDSDRARVELDSARYFVRFVEETSPEAVEIRALGEKGRPNAETPPPRGMRPR